MAKKRKRPIEDDEAIKVPPGTIEWVKWYPLRWQASEARQTMSLAEQGLYFMLLNLCYIQGSIPADTESLARIAGLEQSVFSDYFARIKSAFRLDKTGSRYINPLANEVIRETLGRITTNRNNALGHGRPKKRPLMRPLMRPLSDRTS